MTDYTDQDAAHLRLSDTERDEAIARLGAYAREGRLSDAEAAERATTARSARTRGDLAPLFADLPRDSAAGAVASSTEARPRSDYRRWGVVASALMPFVALSLFFLSGNAWGYEFAWLWFLLIPVTGILVWGPGNDHDRRYRDDRYR